VSALADGGLVGTAHLRAGVRSQNAAGLQRLARRIQPAVGWSDLALPADVLSLLDELAPVPGIGIACSTTGGCVPAVAAAGA
jgi:hypothetical protein